VNQQKIKVAVRALAVIGAAPLLLWCSFILCFSMLRGFGWPFECGEFDKQFDQPSWRRPWFGDFHLPAVVADVYATLLVNGAIIVAVVKIWKAQSITQFRIVHLCWGMFICAAVVSLWRFESAQDPATRWIWRYSPSTSAATRALERLGLPPSEGLLVGRDFDHFHIVLKLPLLLGFICASCLIAKNAWTTASWVAVGIAWCIGRSEALRSVLGLQERFWVTALKLTFVVVLPAAAMLAALYEWQRLVSLPPKIERIVATRRPSVTYLVKSDRTTEVFYIDPLRRNLLAVEVYFTHWPLDEPEAQRGFEFGDPPFFERLHDHQPDGPHAIAGRVEPLTEKMKAAAARLEDLFTGESLAKQPHKVLVQHMLSFDQHWLILYPSSYDELAPYQAMDEAFYREHR